MIERIGPYLIQRELGRGGMGVGYLATHTRLERFEREAKTLASLNHPNLAGIHGVEELDGARYLVLEYVEGQTLSVMLDRGPLPVEDTIKLSIMDRRWWWLRCRAPLRTLRVWP